MTKTKLTFYYLLSLLYLTSCKQNTPIKHSGEKDLISFTPLFGIGYTEVSRRLGNGLSFSTEGYQLEPEWQIKFVSNDSASIYSPTKKAFINFPLTRGYDSIFNTARTWFKVKKMTKDSLLLHLFQAKMDSLDTRGTDVYMTFYANNFIKSKIRKDVTAIKAPSKRDTLFIRALTDSANKDIQKAFAARQPAIMVSKSRLIKIKPRHAVGDIMNNFNTTDDYMNPTVDITVEQVPEEFYYSFSVIVDSRGVLHYNKPLVPFTGKGYELKYIAGSKAVMDKYLKHLLNVKPGSTLGMVHPSSVAIHVEGKKRL